MGKDGGTSICMGDMEVDYENGPIMNNGVRAWTWIMYPEEL